MNTTKIDKLDADELTENLVKGFETKNEDAVIDNKRKTKFNLKLCIYIAAFVLVLISFVRVPYSGTYTDTLFFEYFFG
jgi:hypothetical protein